MITIEGHYFDGKQPIGMAAKMDFTGHEAALTAGIVSMSYATSYLRVSPRIGSADRFITLPDGGQFGCPDHSFLDSLPQESPTEGPVAWLEERWGIAAACIAVIVCTLLGAYFYGLPAAAEHIAEHIPLETEYSLGSQAIAFLDEKGWLDRTKLDVERQKEIAGDFYRLAGGLPMKDYYRLMFRSGKAVGANAIALPGGIIIITDDMVKAAETEEEVMAVLAHEIGHVELRHTMRGILQNSVVGAAVAAVTSDAASLSVAIAGLPVVAAQTKYSREFEEAADEYAFRLLKQKGYSPTAFAALMERLSKKDKKEMGPLSFLSTHPVTAERIQRACDAAKE